MSRFHSGHATIGLRCKSSHHWARLARYDAASERLILLAVKDAFCPVCGCPDTEFERTGQITRGWKDLGTTKPSLLTRIREWLML